MAGVLDPHVGSAAASARAAALPHRRAMVATKPANPSIINIASVCGIRGSGKECISYQVRARLHPRHCSGGGSEAVKEQSAHVCKLRPLQQTAAIQTEL